MRWCASRLCKRALDERWRCVSARVRARVSRLVSAARALGERDDIKRCEWPRSSPATAAAMEVGRRYVEQLQTTLETMRRRCVAAYDLGVRASERSVKLVERAREVGEPALYDMRDHVVAACNEVEPLDAADRETRNSLVELYLGVAVLLVGCSAGELTGVALSTPLFSRVFDAWAALALVVALPAYVYLTFRKNAALDETERRVWLFGLALAEGALLGHVVGERLVRLIPAAFFVQPLVCALLVDYEIAPDSLYADRTRLLGTAAALGGGGALLIATLPLSALALGVIVMAAAHVALLFMHFQLVIAAIKSKTFGAGEAQLGYMLALVALQVLIAVPLGGARSF